MTDFWSGPSDLQDSVPEWRSLVVLYSGVDADGKQIIFSDPVSGPEGLEEKYRKDFSPYFIVGEGDTYDEAKDRFDMVWSDAEGVKDDRWADKWAQYAG